MCPQSLPGANQCRILIIRYTNGEYKQEATCFRLRLFHRVLPQADFLPDPGINSFKKTNNHQYQP